MRCEGKIVLVTGAQRGIGRAVALRFAREGAHVALNFLDDKTAAEAAAAEIAALGRRCSTIGADGSKPAEARRLVGEVERGLEARLSNMLTQSFEKIGGVVAARMKAGSSSGFAIRRR